MLSVFFSIVSPDSRGNVSQPAIVQKTVPWEKPLSNSVWNFHGMVIVFI